LIVCLKEFLVSLNQPIVISKNKGKTQETVDDILEFHNKSNSNGRRNLNDFGKFGVVKLMHIIASPFPIAEDVMILFATIRKQIFGQVGIQTRRAVFTTGRIRKRTSFGQSFIVPSSIGPKATNIAKINQFLNLLGSIEVFLEFYAIKFLIPVKMAIYREYRSIREFITKAGTGAHWGRLLITLLV
jgi:hypothetical protein